MKPDYRLLLRVLALVYGPIIVVMGAVYYIRSAAQ